MPPRASVQAFKVLCHRGPRHWYKHSSTCTPSSAKASKESGRQISGWLLLSVPAVATPSAWLGATGASETVTDNRLEGPRRLTGTWIRDNSASELDSYGRMLELMQLGGLQRTTALKLIEGLQLTESDEGLFIQFLTVVPFFKVTEEVKFSATTQQPRRDARPGHQIARAAKTASGAYVEMVWKEPMAGRLSETYHVSGDKLYVRSEVEIGNQSEGTTVVYVRRDKWRPQFKFPGS